MDYLSNLPPDSDASTYTSSEDEDDVKETCHSPDPPDPPSEEWVSPKVAAEYAEVLRRVREE